VLVNQDRFADGVSAAGLAAGHGWPILLSGATVIPQATVDAWRALSVTKVVLVGGSAVLGDNIETFLRDRGRCATQPGCVAERLAGDDRYATSVAAAQRSIAIGDRTDGTVLLGTGVSYPDTLASGPLAARLNGIALLVDGSGRGGDGASRAFLTAHASSIRSVSILGGPGAVTSAADRAIQDALGLH
jgi:putative cell wall-binding protein